MTAVPPSSDAISYAFRDSSGDELPIVASLFTPYQLLFFERLWAQITPRPLLILDSRPERFRAGRPPVPVHDIEPLALTGQVNSAEQAALVRRGLAAADTFVGERPFAFVCGSYQWPINTAFYYRHRRNPNCSLFLIEEGLSSYLDIRPSRRERRRNLAREAVARLRGFPPRAFVPGHPLGHDIPSLKGIILAVSRPPLGGPRPRPFLLLPAAPDTRVQFSPEGAIVIGQPYLNELGETKLATLAAAIHKDLVRRGFRRIAFKPHHYQPETEIAIYARAGFELVNPPLALEEMIVESSFRTVVGFNSTALLTTKSLFGAGIHAIAYNPSQIVPRHEGRDEEALLALFREANVEIVSLNDPMGVAV